MVRALGSGAPLDRGVLYLGLGGLANLAIAVGRLCLFTRTVPGGLEPMVAALAERRGLTLEHARAWLMHVGLEAPVEEIEGDREIVVQARAVLEEGVHRVVDGVRNSLDFYGAQADAPAVASIVVTGPAVAVPGLTDALADRLGMPVEQGTVAQARPGAVAPEAAPCVAVAAGLAVEELPA
jgi:type IV pilus assembly protein PilM